MRFHLRTLLIAITEACGVLGWLGWQVRVVGNRRSIAAKLDREHVGDVIWEHVGWGENVERVIEGDRSRRVPWVRKLLGDENAQAVVFYSADSTKRAAIEAFPEADIYLP